MGSALDNIAFLALSENRIAILGILSDEENRTRDDVMDAADVSRPTLARILDDLEDRGWITQRGQNCRITALGAWIHEEFTELLETMATAEKLRDVVAWFPTDEGDFDVIRCLNDAEFAFATESDPTAPIRCAGEQVRTGTRLRFLTTQVAVSYFGSIREAITRNGMTVEGVVTLDVYDTLVNNSAMADLCRDLYDSGAVAFFITDDPPPIVQIVDGNVGIGLVDEAKRPQGLVLSDNEAVREWATATFESYRERSAHLPTNKISQREGVGTDVECLEESLDTS